MKFSLTVDSPREAGYATSMFQALQAAMTADPPPVAQFSQTRFGDVSHTVLTGGDFPSTGITPSSPFQVNVPTTGADTTEAGDQKDDTSQIHGQRAPSDPAVVDQTRHHERKHADSHPIRLLSPEISCVRISARGSRAVDCDDTKNGQRKHRQQ